MQKCQLVIHAFSDQMYIEFHLSSPMLRYGNSLKPNMVSIITELRIQLGETVMDQIITQTNIKLQQCSAARSYKKSCNGVQRRLSGGDSSVEIQKHNKNSAGEVRQNVCQAENAGLRRTWWAGACMTRVQRPERPSRKAPGGHRKGRDIFFLMRPERDSGSVKELYTYRN